LGGDADWCPHRYNTGRVKADFAYRGGWICAMSQQHAAGVERGLLGSLANNFVDALKADIEVPMSALATTTKGGRDNDDELCHRTSALRDDRIGRRDSDVDRTNGPSLFWSHSSSPDVGYSGVRPASRKGGPSELTQAILASVFGEQGIP
jgi:hypothetical protein